MVAQLAVSELDKVIGKRIQSKRKEQGFSADKLSEKIGIFPTTTFALRTGRQ